MKKIITALTIILSMVLVANLSAKKTIEKLETLTGTINEVSLKSNMIVVKQDNRLIKFSANKAMCKEYNNKLNAQVNVTYVQGRNKKMFIKKIETVAVPVEKNTDKNKMKKTATKKK